MGNQLEGAKVISCATIANQDYSGKDFSGLVFRSCTFTNVIFKNAILKDCEFYNCYTEEKVSFEGADMTGCTLHNVVMDNTDFTKAILVNSNIINADLSKSSLHAVKFNGSHINGLKVGGCNMNMASFENTEIANLDYSPVRHQPYMKGINIFVKGNLHNNTIFISGNQHTDFYDYCLYERRKDKFFNSVNKTSLPIRPFAVLFLLLFGLFTDFGQSFRRWTVCTIGIIVFYALVPILKCGAALYDAFLASLLAFFGFGEIPFGYDFFYVGESVIGYFMLGALISLLTNKLSIN